MRPSRIRSTAGVQHSLKTHRYTDRRSVRHTDTVDSQGRIHMKDSGPCFARYLNPEVDGSGYPAFFHRVEDTLFIRGYDRR